MSDPDESAMRSGPLPHWVAVALVFGTSAAVLVLEILAGRLLAPYVGVSIETFTGIIGVVLAGIAVGSWMGGVVADRVDPRRLIPPLLVVGGALAISSIPIVRVLGEGGDGGTSEILVLTTFGFLPFSIVLSAILPAVVKLQLRSLDTTGATVGQLSAWGTAGALFGTFITGFVLVATAAVTTLIVYVGIALIVIGFGWWVVRLVGGQSRDGGVVAAGLVVAALGGLGVAAIDSPCDTQTTYYCVRVVTDADEPSVRVLVLDDLSHSAIDVDDPTRLPFWYVRRLADAIDAHHAPEAPLDVLHIGGGALGLPRHLAADRPGSDQTVVEIDEQLVTVVAAEFGPVDGEVAIITGDGRQVVGDLGGERFDLVVGDAFGSRSVPFHLTTREFVDEVRSVLRLGGWYLMNVIDGPGQDFVRAEARTLADVFVNVTVIRSQPLVEGRSGNAVLVASDGEIDDDELASALALDVDGVGGEVIGGDDLAEYVGDASLLTDDFAPVDQLIRS